MEQAYYKNMEPFWGSWRIKRLLGEGSFGKVFEIEREDFGRTYRAAMKAITIPQSESELKSVLADGMDVKSATNYYKSFVEEVVDEFVLMADLKGNSNIVSYEDHMVAEHPDRIGWDIFIRMELLTPLLDYTSTERPMGQQEVVKLGVDICKALEFCQKRNIIHRDIKPENIFISPSGDYKLGDFGIARTVEKTTSGLSRKGTYTYMAPEVYKGEKYGSSVDIYSLGIVLYRLLNYNRAPFLPAFPEPITYSDRETSVTRRIGGEPIPMPAQAQNRLGEIILKACEYKPENRYHSPEEMRLYLEAVLGNQEQKSNHAAHTPVQNAAESTKKTGFLTSQALMEESTVMEERTEAEELTAIEDRTEAEELTAMEDKTLEEEKTVIEEPAEDDEATVSMFGTVSVPEQKIEKPDNFSTETAASEKEEPPKKKSKKGLFIGAGVAAAVLIAVCIGLGRRGSKDIIIDDPEMEAQINDKLEEAFGGDAAAEESDSDPYIQDMTPINSNKYLYGRYQEENTNLLGIPEDAFLEGMEYITIRDKEVTAVPCEMYCFPDGSVYNTPLLGDWIDEIAFDTYVGAYACNMLVDMPKEEVFETIVYQLFGEEAVPQAREFYEKNIKGQRDTAEMVFFDRTGARQSFIGYYKIDNSLLDFAYLDMDESGQLCLRSEFYDVDFLGCDLILSMGDVTRVMKPYTPYDTEEYQFSGYASSEADAYMGISYLFVRAYPDKGNVSVYFADKWRADQVSVETGPDNTITVSWEQQARLGNPAEKKQEPGSFTCQYLLCGDIGFILKADGRDYFYQKTEMEYYSELLGDSVVDQEVDEDTLQRMGLTQQEIQLALKEAFEASSDIDVNIDENTGKITLDSGILFETDSSDLSEEGMDYLDHFFSVCEEVIFGGGYDAYIDEIIVEGHTDSSGDYGYNQFLSEERAYMVEDYCYENYTDLSFLMDVVGCASDELIYDENGNEDSEASRRVVFKITLDAEAF